MRKRNHISKLGSSRGFEIYELVPFFVIHGARHPVPENCKIITTVWFTRQFLGEIYVRLRFMGYWFMEYLLTLGLWQTIIFWLGIQNWKKNNVFQSSFEISFLICLNEFYCKFWNDFKVILLKVNGHSNNALYFWKFFQVISTKLILFVLFEIIVKKSPTSTSGYLSEKL